MPRTPARFTQADINRALRAIQQCDVEMRVKLLPDGSIVIEKSGDERIAWRRLRGKAGV